MGTWTQDLTVKRESSRWIQKMSGGKINKMWVIITHGNWKKIKEERMMISGINQVMVSPTKKEKKKKQGYGIWGEKWVKAVSPVWLCWVEDALDALNCRCWVDSWVCGARAQKRGQQNGNCRWVCQCTQNKVSGGHYSEAPRSPFSELLFAPTAKSTIGWEPVSCFRNYFICKDHVIPISRLAEKYLKDYKAQSIMAQPRKTEEPFHFQSPPKCFCLFVCFVCLFVLNIFIGV